MDAQLHKYLGTQGIYSCNVSGYKSNQLAIAFTQLQCLKIFKRLLTNLWETLILGVQNTKYSVYIYISNLTKRLISYQWVIITLYCWWIMESSALYLVKNNISRWTKQTLFIENNFTLKDCFFVSVKLAENADLHKYVYNGYGIGFNLRSEFSLPDGSVGKNFFIIFGVDMSSSVHIDNKGKDILILGIGSIQGLDDSTLIS